MVGTYSSVFTATPLAVWFEALAGRKAQPRRAPAGAGGITTNGEAVIDVSDQIHEQELPGIGRRYSVHTEGTG